MADPVRAPAAPGPGSQIADARCAGHHGTAAMSAIVTARNLSKRYKNTVALDSVNFEIESGRIVGLIGPNGAGKTTALKAILGLTPFDGELSVLGYDPRTQRKSVV